MLYLDTVFMQHALLAGTGVGLACGLVGYLTVLRAQVFLGDALSHVAFVGSLGALVAGLAPMAGLFAATVGTGVVLGLLGQEGSGGGRVGGRRGAADGGRRGARAGNRGAGGAQIADDIAIGALFAWILALGALLLTVYTTSKSAGNAAGGVNVLFGSILGLSSAQAWTGLAVGIAVSVLSVLLARPLIFSTVDPAVAAAHGIPVRTLGIAFAGLMGLCAAEATQAVGSLLLLGLIAAPGGAARVLTANPYRGLVLSAAIAVVSVWAGLLLSALIPHFTPATAILGVAGLCFVLAHVPGQVSARIAARSVTA
ncbi:MAG TPA: metal ABC transporter permease [Actinocrinis sp.]|nr:metal ABC transporter permease [Actinocrinis sp.]